MKYFLLILLLFPVIINAQDIIPIAEIRENVSSYIGETVSIEGIVTMGHGIIHSSQLRAYIQDDSERGIMLFDFSVAPYQDIVRGAKLAVTGEVELYAGVLEIVDFSYTVLETGLDHPVIPLSIEEAQNYDVWEGTMISVSGTLYEDPYHAGGGANVNIEDEYGDRITIRVWDSTGIDLDNLTAGIPITADGVGSFYGNAGQLLPGYQEDIRIDIAEPVIQDVSWSPEIPFIDEEITVTATVIDFDGFVQSVRMKYWLESEDEVLDDVVMDHIGNDQYRYTLPAMETITEVEDNYIIRILATDDDGNTGQSELLRITVRDRSPIIEDMTHNQPEPDEPLEVSVRIYDTDGEVIDAKLLYTLNHGSTIHEADLDQVGQTDTYEGVIPGQKGGTLVSIGAYAIDDDDLVSIEYDMAQYTYPVRTHEALIRVKPKPFNPSLGETFEIGYHSRSGNKAILRIYNAEGKLVYTPKNEILTAQDGINYYHWDGRNRAGQIQPIGMYICHLEVIDVDSGTKKTAKVPIVIGTKLK